MTKLRALREAAGVDQTAFAAEIGISVASYGPIERGNAKPTKRIAVLLETKFAPLRVDDLIAEAA